MAAQTSPISKSDFIRAQPASLSVAQVIAKGQAEEIKFGSSLVYMVRRPAKKKKPAKTAAVAPATKPASSTASKSNLPSKSEFIRSQPGSLSAAEVVAKGKGGGHHLQREPCLQVAGPLEGEEERRQASRRPRHELAFEDPGPEERRREDTCQDEEQG